MKFKEVALSTASTEAKVAALALLMDKELIKLADTVLNVKKLHGPQGEQGLQGPKGEQGDRGFDGTNGKDGSDGKDGKDGKDGEDGKQGVGVADAKIDFDGSLVITLTDGTEINAGEIVPLDTAEKIRVIGNGGGTSQSVLDAIAAIQATIATYGTMATQNANNVAITGGAINGTTVGATTPAAGTFTTLTATGTSYLGGSATSRNVQVDPVAGGTTQFTQFSRVTATNEQQIIAANIANLGLVATGGGTINFWTSTTGEKQFVVGRTASAVNYVQVTGAATTKATVVSSAGSDSNISSVFQSKGTGAIDLAAGSSGVNISNGGTVTAITGTNIGASYTSFPSVVISAPTTAGGVQATASVAGMISNNPVTIVSGGIGYTVGDTLTVVGGTSISGAATLTVNSVSAGVITAVFNLNFAGYTVLPTNPVSVTGGTGTGATFNLTYSLRSASGFTITNAGSGYVEQPTVSFSGGGGSGAAAYATVGSYATIKAIGSGTNKVTNQAITFETPNSITSGNPAFLIRDAASFDSWYQMGPSSSQAFLVAKGNANASAYLGASGSGSVRFTTNGDSITEQMRVSHTASAVNYVQVTGAATGSNPTISAQGSDSTIPLNITAKGGQPVYLVNGSGNGLRVYGGTNYFNMAGAGSGSAPAISAIGSDTNIDLALTTKGTGNVRFGTYTASMAFTIQGYIEIKDSGGTVRKLAVIA